MPPKAKTKRGRSPSPEISGETSKKSKTSAKVAGEQADSDAEQGDQKEQETQKEKKAKVVDLVPILFEEAQKRDAGNSELKKDDLDPTRVHRNTLRPRMKERFSWDEKIAQHLAREKRIIDQLRSQVNPKRIHILESYFLSVYLPGLSLVADNARQAVTLVKKTQDSICARVVQILEEVDGLTLHDTITHQTVEPPSADGSHSTLRARLFQLHYTRQVMLDAIHGCNDLQQKLAYQVTNAFAANPESEEHKAFKPVSDEIYAAEQVKWSLRDKLRESVLSNVALNEIQKLLNAVTPTVKLYDMENSTSATEEPLREVALDYDQVAVGITGSDDFSPDFLSDRTFGDGMDGVFMLSTGLDETEKYSDVRTKNSLASEASLSWADMQQVDEECAKWLESEFQLVDQAKFKLFYEKFVSIRSRPEKVNSITGDHPWFWSNHATNVDVMVDNIFHLRSFIDKIRGEGLIDDPDNNLPRMNETLRLMFGLLAVQFGLLREPGLLCIAMDKLLEDLAICIIGHSDAKLETLRSQRLDVLLTKMSGQQMRAVSSLMDQKETSREIDSEYRARQLFSEVARFFRGSVALAVGYTGPQKATTKDESRVWFETLIHWDKACGHPQCRKNLEVRDQAKLKNKHGLSTWNQDRRVGFPNERAAFSDNRLFCYPCLAFFINFNKCHDGLCVFYHYYSHLYHVECKPFERKRVFVEQIELARSYSSSHGASQQEGENFSPDDSPAGKVSLADNSQAMVGSSQQSAVDVPADGEEEMLLDNE